MCKQQDMKARRGNGDNTPHIPHLSSRWEWSGGLDKRLGEPQSRSRRHGVEKISALTENRTAVVLS
jgi:hypothetical protein